MIQVWEGWFEFPYLILALDFSTSRALVIWASICFCA
jgi:hypothetical protein